MTMTYEQLLLFGEAFRQCFYDVDGTMFSARTADGHREIAAGVFGIAR